MDTWIVLSNLPDRNAALELAQALVERRLAACVNVLAECTSVYRWQGAIERATEVPVLIKTTAQRYPALEQAIRELHPYELPEIVAVPIGGGLSGYLQWVADETRSET
jgi:periplasmic divalent cation tolerance protein